MRDGNNGKCGSDSVSAGVSNRDVYKVCISVSGFRVFIRGAIVCF